MGFPISRWKQAVSLLFALFDVAFILLSLLHCFQSLPLILDFEVNGIQKVFFVGLAAYMIVAVQVLILIKFWHKKILADYLNLHWECIEFKWTKWSNLTIKINRVISWVNWFEHPADKHSPNGPHIDVPLSLIYRNIRKRSSISTRRQSQTQPTEEHLKMFGGRVPLERWDEKNRLLLNCIDCLSIELSWKQPASILIHGLRTHQPSTNAQIIAEQSILFPQGYYPNYFGIAWEKSRRFHSIIAFIIEWILTNCKLSIGQVEVHGIQNPTFGSLQSPTGDKSKRLLTVKLGAIQVNKYDKVTRRLNITCHQLAIYEGNNFVLRESGSVFSLLNCSVTLKLRRLIDAAVDKMQTAVLEPVSVQLYQGPDTEKKGKALELSVGLLLDSTQVQIDSEFISKLTFTQLPLIRFQGVWWITSAIVGELVSSGARQGNRWLSGRQLDLLQDKIVQLWW